MFSLEMRNNRFEAFKRMGNTYQLAGTRHYELTDGNCKNTEVIDVKTGSGLEYSVVPDRGMDISIASYKGINLTYITRNQEVYPSFYENNENNWLRTFHAGLLTTCGPTYLGPPCVDEGEALGLHGRHSIIPAKKVCDMSSFEDGEIFLKGTVEDCTLFGDKIVVHRNINSKIGESAIIIQDVVENIGSQDSPFTLLYHINFGYPLLCEHTEVYVQSKDCNAYDEYSKQYMDEINSFKKPSGKNKEKNYWHVFDQDKETAYAIIINRKLLAGIGVYIKFDPKILPYLTQWKLEDEIDYILALEPSNTLCYSRNELRNKGLLPVIKASEKKKMKVEIGVIEGSKRIDQFLESTFGEKYGIIGAGYRYYRGKSNDF